jgi:hypothetical protein
MQKVFQISAQEVVPSIGAILESQGIPRWVQPDARVKQLAHDALSLYKEKANPVGTLMEIKKDKFKSVFDGEGCNEVESPVNPIYQAADDIAVFAVTIGESVCREISRMFQQNDFALGSMLDAAASEGAEMTAQVVENIYRQHLREKHRFDHRRGTLRFSPGYCGWHISAQRKLFDALQPGEIGITLNESYLMQPIKSISGVIISGSKHIFDFEDVFSFCGNCAMHTCRDRINALFEQ